MKVFKISIYWHFLFQKIAFVAEIFVSNFGFFNVSGLLKFNQSNKKKKYRFFKSNLFSIIDLFFRDCFFGLERIKFSGYQAT